MAEIDVEQKMPKRSPKNLQKTPNPPNPLSFWGANFLFLIFFHHISQMKKGCLKYEFLISNGEFENLVMVTMTITKCSHYFKKVENYKVMY